MRHYTVARAGYGALLVQARMVWGTMDLRTEQPTRADCRSFSFSVHEEALAGVGKVTLAREV